MLEASQLDSYGLQFTKPTFISLDPTVTSIPNLPIAGIRIGVNGVEEATGQAYVPLIQTIGAGYAAGAGQQMSAVGTVMALEHGRDRRHVLPVLRAHRHAAPTTGRRCRRPRRQRRRTCLPSPTSACAPSMRSTPRCRRSPVCRRPTRGSHHVHAGQAGAARHREVRHLRSLAADRAGAARDAVLQRAGGRQHACAARSSADSTDRARAPRCSAPPAPEHGESRPAHQRAHHQGGRHRLQIYQVNGAAIRDELHNGVTDPGTGYVTPGLINRLVSGPTGASPTGGRTVMKAACGAVLGSGATLIQ